MRKIGTLILLAVISFGSTAMASDFLPVSQDRYGRLIQIPPMKMRYESTIWRGDLDDDERAMGEGHIEFKNYNPNGSTSIVVYVEGVAKKGKWVGDRIVFVDPEEPHRNVTYWLYDGKPFLAQTGSYPNLGNRYFTIREGSFWDLDVEIDAASFFFVANRMLEGKFPKKSSFESLRKYYDKAMATPMESNNDSSYTRNEPSSGGDGSSSGSSYSESRDSGSSSSSVRKSETKKKLATRRTPPGTFSRDSGIDLAPIMGTTCISIKRSGSGITSDRFDIKNRCTHPIQVLFCEQRNWNSNDCDNEIYTVGWGTTEIIKPGESNTVVSMFSEIMGSAYMIYTCDMSRGGNCLIPAGISAHIVRPDKKPYIYVPPKRSQK